MSETKSDEVARAKNIMRTTHPVEVTAHAAERGQSAGGW
jgi:hypothetical protein